MAYQAKLPSSPKCQTVGELFLRTAARESSRKTLWLTRLLVCCLLRENDAAGKAAKQKATVNFIPIETSSF
jgi:hypothetical protein